MSNEEEGNMLMKRKKVGVVKCGSRPYYFFRGCNKHKKKSLSLSLSLCSISRATTIGPLPDELVFLILLELEAEEIHNSAMLVCRQWYKIIRTQNFLQEHLKRSSSGLMALDDRIAGDPTFKILLSGRRRRSRIHQLKHSSICKSKLMFWAPCNGLSLEECPFTTDSDKLFVANYAINKRIQLPPFVPPRSLCYFYNCIGYAPASNEYKVVHLYDHASKKSSLERCAVLTLGIDKSWRYIDTQNISGAGADLEFAPPLTTPEFVHWAKRGRGTCFLSLHMESEIFTETFIPEEARVHPEFNYYLSTWKSLTLLIPSPPHGLLSWDVWELESSSSTWEWTKVMKIDLEDQRCRLEGHFARTLPKYGLTPVGWLNYMELLVLHVPVFEDKACVLYNVGTQETEFLDLGRVRRAFLHKSSLLWFDPPT